MLDLHIAEKRHAPGQAVLRDIRLRAAPGQIAALLGRSGIGKTSLLRIVLGLDRDFDGHVTLSPGRVAAVFQEPRLLPWLTVLENLRLVLPPGTPAPDLEALLEELGVPGVGPQRPATLSLGMARRVAIARALAVPPALLVLDEPFASLDRQRAEALGQVLRARAGQGALVLVAMHDAEHALALADRVLVLDGAPATLVDDVSLRDAQARAVTRERLRGRYDFLGS